MKFRACVCHILLAAVVVRGDVEFTKPAAGDQLAAGSTIEVRWRDVGGEPATATIESYRLTLCAGGNKDGSSIELMPIVNAGHFDTGSVAQGFVPAMVGGSTENGYFVKMTITVPGRGSVTRFSPRFGYIGMSGNFPPDVRDAIRELPAGYRAPLPVNHLSPPGQTMTDIEIGVGTARFHVPFAEQRGRTRYAPMQIVPPTKISARTRTPLHPTSSVPIAHSRLPPATAIETTVTESRTYSVHMVENGAAPWPGPHADEAARAHYRERWGLHR